MNIAPTRVTVTSQTTLQDLRTLAQPRYDRNELRVSGSSAKIKLSSAFLFRDAVAVTEHWKGFVTLLKRAVAQELSSRPGAGVEHFPQGDAADLVDRHREAGPAPVYTVAGLRRLLAELDRPTAVPATPVRVQPAPESSRGGHERTRPAAPSTLSASLEPTAADFATPPAKPVRTSSSSSAAATPASRLQDQQAESCADELQAVTLRLDSETARKLGRLVVERGDSTSGRENELLQAKMAVTTWVARQIGASNAMDLVDPSDHPGRKPYWDILQQQTATPAPR